MAEEKWYFTKEQLSDSPSRKCGIEPQQESKYRQQAADLIQNMGQSLMVSQLCINTAIVYMHRFYAFHSFTHFHRNHIAAASLFLAAKVEEQPRKLQSVIEAGHNCLYPKSGRIDINSEHFLEQTQDLIFNENILLQTLGFDVAIDHPHTHVVKTCHLVRAPKDLAQSSYFMASNSLHKTTMCLQYKPTVVACFCIHVACKWSNWQIPQSKEGKHWFEYVDTSVTTELLDRLTLEFLHYFDTNRSSDRARSDLNQERDSRKALAAQEEAHHRQHSSSSRNVHNSAHQGHSSQSVPHVNTSQHRHGQHKISSSQHATQAAPYTQQHGNHHSSSSQAHYNSQNPNLIPTARDQHKKVDDKMKHHPDYAKMQNMNRPRVPPDAMPNKNAHSRHKPDMHVAHNAFVDRSKEVNEGYQNRLEVPDQRASNVMNRTDHYKSEKDLKPKANPVPGMDMKKRDFNNIPKSNMNEYMSQNIQKPPPNYHEYKNQNSAASASKHMLVNENKYIQKPEIKPVVNPMGILEEPPKSEMVRTPPSKPSIFSPDNKDMGLYKKSKPELKTPKKQSPGRKMETPPSKKLDRGITERTPSQPVVKTESKSKPNSAMRLTDTPILPTVGNNPIIPRPISPFISPLKKSNSSSRNRTRTSSSSDAELVPVVKKLEDLSEYGDFFRDKINIQNANDKLQNSVANTIKAQTEMSTANGIETNPDLISSLLKESLLGIDNTMNSTNSNSLQMTIPPTTVPNISDIQSNTNDEFKHKSEKKKKKDKHKHKDKSKEERKKHKKDKERTKERQDGESNSAQSIPIKITIPKDKIDMAEPSIKIKIPKERIKSLPRNDSSGVEPMPRPVQGLKIKIPKEAMDNYSESSKKRERALSADRGPPTKSTRAT